MKKVLHYDEPTHPHNHNDNDKKHHTSGTSHSHHNNPHDHDPSQSKFPKGTNRISPAHRLFGRALQKHHSTTHHQQHHKRPDSRLGQRGSWDMPDENKMIKKRLEEQRRLEEMKNAHQLITHLARKTHFTTEQVDALLRIYKRLTSIGKMDRLRFREIWYSTFHVTDDIILDRIFCAFDGDSMGTVSETEWVIGMSACLRGNLQEQIAYCFEVYDLGGERGITRDEVAQFLRNCVSPIPGQGTAGIDPEEVAECSREITELAMKKLDVDRNGIITYGDFFDAVNRDPLLLEALGQCLPTVKTMKTFLSLFADDYYSYSLILSHPKDIGWDRERDKFARRTEILENMKGKIYDRFNHPLLTHREIKKGGVGVTVEKNEHLLTLQERKSWANIFGGAHGGLPKVKPMLIKQQFHRGSQHSLQSAANSKKSPKGHHGGVGALRIKKKE